jgi:hypothetical protein
MISRMDSTLKNWVTPQSSLKLGDRVLLISQGVGREGEVVAVGPSGLARVALSDGTLKSLSVDANPLGTVLRLDAS